MLGIETDFDWSGIRGSDSQSLSGAPFRVPIGLTTTAENKLNWIGTVRGRIGYLLTPSLMVFATGGFAYGQVDTNVNTSLNAELGRYASIASAASFNNSSTQTGWTVGAGFETQFWGNWSLKAEYRFVDLGNNDNAFGTSIVASRTQVEALSVDGRRNGIPVNFGSNQDNQYQMGLVGLNYRF